MKVKNKIYFTSVIFALVCLILTLFLVYPTLKDIKNISDGIYSDKKEAALIYQQSNELDSFKKDLNSYKANLDKIDGLFIDPKNPVEFLKFLENTAYVSGVIVDINLVQNEKKTEVSNSLSSLFQVDAKGDFSSMLFFAEKLESGPYLARIQNLSMSKEVQVGKDQKPVNITSAHFLLEVLYKQK